MEIFLTHKVRYRHSHMSHSLFYHKFGARKRVSSNMSRDETYHDFLFQRGKRQWTSWRPFIYGPESRQLYPLFRFLAAFNNRETWNICQR